MAAEISTSSSCISRATSGEVARRDESALGKMKALVERQRADNASLQKALDLERSGVRALKAQHEAMLRQLRSEAKRKEDALDRQLRGRPLSEGVQSPSNRDNKKRCAEIESLKSVNKSLQEKLKIATEAAVDSAAQLRTQAAQYGAREAALHKDARAQVHRLLEEIKSKDRIIAQLKKSAATLDDKQVQRMDRDSPELRNLHLHQKGDPNGEDLNPDIAHSEEVFYDSAMSSAPTSLSPQPLQIADMATCSQCRAVQERAEERERECTRLSDALRDARDQLELLEFRLLELEDGAPDKGGRENLTDSDSGCVSPGSRLQDSASPELRRADSHSFTNGTLGEQLQEMLCRANSAEERSCLRQVSLLLHDLHALSSADNEQLQPKRLCDIKSLSKLETDLTLTPVKSPKVIATVNPYSQSRRSISDSLESVCYEPRKISPLQESGIFDDVETEDKGTQTQVYESLECGDLNTEIQRLNSIREKLEKRRVAKSVVLSKTEEEGLECRCVKLGQRHKQYYERRLKFLEGKISIYEAAQDVRKAKLAQRLQNEFILENRIQDLESQLCTLQDKYTLLEEDYCELEELENDTRLQAQQLETDYELATAQLRDMSEQRECSRAQANRLARVLRERETALNERAGELTKRLLHLERAVPALIAWHVVQALGANINNKGQSVVSSRLGDVSAEEDLVEQIRHKSGKKAQCSALVAWQRIDTSDRGSSVLDKRLAILTRQKATIEENAARKQAALEKQIKDLQNQLRDETSKLQKQKEEVENKIRDMEKKLSLKKTSADTEPADPALGGKLHSLVKSERELAARVRELERRETAYLDMLTQADGMWAEMEGGYKHRIRQADTKVSELERERERIHSNCVHAKRQVRELEQSESALRVALEKSERDLRRESARSTNLKANLDAVEADLSSSQAAFVELSNKFQTEMECFRQKTAQLSEQLESEKATSRKMESKMSTELERAKKELARSCNNVQDLEVTNSELREEVESLEAQLTLLQKGITQCKRKCDDKLKTISLELSVKTEELEELRSDVMRRSLRPSVLAEMRECTEYVHDGSIRLPMRYDYDNHHSLNFITSETRCSCPAIRSRLVGSLIEDLFERIHNTEDGDLVNLCSKLSIDPRGESAKVQITDYLLMAISKELVRSIGDADAKADTVEWRAATAACGVAGETDGNAGVLSGAARLASVSCACAAARLCAALPHLADTVKDCQEEVLEHSDVKIMEEQLASAIENIVNCPRCALGTNAIVWSTDV